MLPMSALELGNPVIFCAGMVADNLSFHVNIIARAQPKMFRRRGKLWRQALEERGGRSSAGGLKQDAW